MKLLEDAVIRDRYDVVVVGAGLGGLTAAALLGADLEDAAGFLGHFGDLLPLFNGQGQRLLAVNVFALFHGIDHQLDSIVLFNYFEDCILVCAHEQLPTAAIVQRAGHLVS